MRKANRTTLLAGVVFIGLIGLLVWQWYSQQQQTKTAHANRDFLEFDADSVTDVTITHGGDTMTVQKQDGNWVVTTKDKAAADSAAVSDLLNTLNNALIEATVAQSNAKLDQYGLGEADKFHLVVQANGTTVADVEIGKTGSVARTWYGRKTGESNVYVLSGTRQTLVNMDYVKPAEDTNTSSANPVSEPSE